MMSAAPLLENSSSRSSHASPMPSVERTAATAVYHSAVDSTSTTNDASFATSFVPMPRRSHLQFACLYTKQKTQKRKKWQDGRLVIHGSSAVLHDAHPPAGSSDPQIDACELTHAVLQLLQQQQPQAVSGLPLEMEKHLVTIEGPWNTGSGNQSLLSSLTTTQPLQPSQKMQKVLQKKFQMPTKKPPNPPTQQQTFLARRKRPLQPGELQRQYFGVAQQDVLAPGPTVMQPPPSMLPQYAPGASLQQQPQHNPPSMHPANPLSATAPPQGMHSLPSQFTPGAPQPQHPPPMNPPPMHHANPMAGAAPSGRMNPLTSAPAPGWNHLSVATAAHNPSFSHQMQHYQQPGGMIPPATHAPPPIPHVTVPLQTSPQNQNIPPQNQTGLSSSNNNNHNKPRSSIFTRRNGFDPNSFYGEDESDDDEDGGFGTGMAMTRIRQAPPASQPSPFRIGQDSTAEEFSSHYPPTTTTETARQLHSREHESLPGSSSQPSPFRFPGNHHDEKTTTASRRPSLASSADDGSVTEHDLLVLMGAAPPTTTTTTTATTAAASAANGNEFTLPDQDDSSSDEE